MSKPKQETFTRRIFLEKSLIMASAAATVPAFLHHSALDVFGQTAGRGTSIQGVPQDHVLVVVQLAGGNDGLNTVVPYRDDNYHRVRRGIGITRDQALDLGTGREAGGGTLGLHPALDSMKDLFDDGSLAIIQGVGYPNPNRSHFTSMDIWHTAETDGSGEGWLGKYFDNECAGSPGSSVGSCGGEAGIAIGREAPLAMLGRKSKPISFENADLFRWSGLDVDDSLHEPYETINNTDMPIAAAEGSNAEFLVRTSLDAQVASERIRSAVDRRPPVQYPRTGLSQQLQRVAAMIASGMETRVYYTSIGGFDTHAGQGGPNGRHAQLLREVGGALKAFRDDLAATGNDQRVLTMTFSEFGRRVGQNDSGGTDHGTAAPLFLMGPMVNAGVHARHPSLTDLDNGDLKYNTDFRSIYASILDNWMGSDAEKVLGKDFSNRRLDLLRV